MIQRTTEMSGSVTKVALITASLFAVCVLLAAPFVSSTHNHVGDESKGKCVACVHTFLSLDPSESHHHFSFQLSELGTLVFAGESDVVSELPTANSVRAPPVA